MLISSEYFNQKQILTVFWKGKEIARWPLLYQWNAYSLKLPEGQSSDYFETGKTEPSESPFEIKDLASSEKENLIGETI